MRKEFVPYEPSVRLKALRFDEPCFGFYQLEYGEIRPTMVDDDKQYRLTGYRTCKNSEIPKQYTSAPTFSQAFRWFREKHSIYGIILPSYSDNKAVKDRFFYEVVDSKKIKQELEYHTTHEEAELACLEKLIEIVEFKSE